MEGVACKQEALGAGGGSSDPRRLLPSCRPVAQGPACPDSRLGAPAVQGVADSGGHSHRSCAGFLAT